MLARASCESTAGPSGPSAPGVGRVLANELERVQVLNEPPCVHVCVYVALLQTERSKLINFQKTEDGAWCLRPPAKNALVLPSC